MNQFTYNKIKIHVEVVLPKLPEVIKLLESASALEGDIDKEAIKSAASKNSSAALIRVNQILEEKLSFWQKEHSETLTSLFSVLGKAGVVALDKLTVKSILAIIKRLDYVYRDFVSKVPKKINNIVGTQKFTFFEFGSLLIELLRGTITNKEAIDVLIQDEEIKKVLAGLPPVPPERPPPSTLEESQILRLKQLAGLING